MEITSTTNEFVKNCAKLQQKKYRNETGKFLLEGYKAIKEAFDYGVELESVFVDKDRTDEYDFVKNMIIKTSSAVLNKLSSTESPPPAVAGAKQKIYNIDCFKKFNKVILLENIKDLGNLGTIIRTAVAFGCDGIVLYGDCADLYNPKCVRSAVGNLWKIPVIHIDDLSVLKRTFEKFSRVATLPKSKNSLKKFKTDMPVLVMFGSEADGLSQILQDISTDNVKIEMSDNVESLNLASSASVVMYELFV